MSIFYGGLGLFLVMCFLVVLFHMPWWKFSNYLGGGLRSWVSSFECGFLPQLIVEKYFSYTYFFLLVFFVIFDLEVSLLLNLPLQGCLFKKMGSYLFFLILLCAGFWVEIEKGYVKWSY